MVKRDTATATRYRLTVSIKGGGSVKLFPELEMYRHGAIVSISALPDDGWRFDKWSGDISGSNPRQTFVMNSSRIITASFTAVQTLTISTTGRGITQPRPGTHVYDRGTRLYVSALAESGWKLEEWSGNILGRDSTRSVTINSDKKITAVFTKQHLHEKPAVSYIANGKSKEVHSSDCRWVTKMSERNKIPLSDFGEVYEMIKNRGYNGCFYCLHRYDRDSLSRDTVIRNIEEDLSR